MGCSRGQCGRRLQLQKGIRSQNCVYDTWQANNVNVQNGRQCVRATVMAKA